MKIIFMGTPDFSVPVLKRLIDEQYEIIAVVTQPDKKVGRKRILTPSPVKVEATKHNIQIFQPTKIKEEYEKIIALKPDLIITVAFGQILPKAILQTPKHGCINVHASLLPKLRGGAPIHYAIINGEDKTGITIMYMVEQLDAGDILSKIEIPIEEIDNVESLHNKLSIVGSNLLIETIPLLLEGKINPQKQNEKEATFAYNIKREQEKINWEKTGEQIYNHIRGLNPWPVAYTKLNGETLKIWWGEKQKTIEKTTPGNIIEKETDGFIVATGNNTAIKITDLQLSGKKK